MLFLPLVFLVLLTLILYSRKGKFSFADAFFGAVVLTALGAVFAVEMLGAFHIITPFYLRLVWAGAAVSALAVVVAGGGRAGLSFPFKFSWRMLSSFEIVCLCVLVFVAVLTAVVAWMAPPNNWDSLTYHLPRIMHWAKQGSLDFYTTDIPRQNYYMPGAEYLLLNLFLLTANDRWFNFLQWASLMLSALGVALIIRQLQRVRAAQWLGAVLVATIPMALLQATSTQTDLVESCWLVMALYFLLRWQKSQTMDYLFLFAAAWGLAVLTKGTFFILIPVVVWVFLATPGAWGKKWLSVFMAGFVLAAIVMPFIVRAAKVKASDQFIIQDFHPKAIFLNGVRHASVHWTLPTRQDIPWLENALAGVYHFLGEDPLVGVAKTVSFGGRPLMFKGARDEDYAGNLIHWILYVAVVFGVWLSPYFRPLRWFAGSLILAGAAFMLVPWQPWISRFHLPFFVLFSSVAGLWLGPKMFVRWVVLGLVTFSAAFFLLANQTRPLVGPNRLTAFAREDFYFIKKPKYQPVFMRAAEILRASGCRDVGLIQGGDSWEYPLWALTGLGEISFRDWVDGYLSPCMLITLDRLMPDMVVFHQSYYQKIWESGVVQIFRPLPSRSRIFEIQ